MIRRFISLVLMIVLAATELRGAPPTTQTLDSTELNTLFPLKGELWAFAVNRNGQSVAVATRSNGKVVVSSQSGGGQPYDDIGRSSLRISPDGQHIAYFAKKDGKWRVVLDGREGQGYDDVGIYITYNHALGGPEFSPDSQHLAYAAALGSKCFVVRDGHQDAPYDHIGVDVESVFFSGDSQHLAYNARRDQTWFVVLDGVESKPYADIEQRSLQYSPDGKHLTYCAAPPGEPDRFVIDGQEQQSYPGRISPLLFSKHGGRYAYVADKVGDDPRIHKQKEYVVVVDGKEGSESSYIDDRSLVFSDDGKHLAYMAAKNGGGFCCVLDGQEGPRCNGASSIRFSPDGKRLAYKAPVFTRWTVVIDGHEGMQYDRIIDQSLTFSPDSKHMAFFAERAGQWCVVVDGHEGGGFNEIGNGLERGSPVFSPDSQHIAYPARIGERWFAIMDGNKGDDYGGDSNSMKFSPDSKHFVYESGKGGNICLVIDGKKGTRFEQIWTVPEFNSSGALEYIARKDGTMFLVRQQVLKQ